MERQAELLPVPYFHVVFTLPVLAGEIAFQNKAIVYAILFRSAAETLSTIAADPKHLGAQLGITAVLPGGQGGASHTTAHSDHDCGCNAQYAALGSADVASPDRPNA